MGPSERVSIGTTRHDGLTWRRPLWQGNAAVKVIDVRTRGQQSGHEINGRTAVGVRGALRMALDNVLDGSIELPGDGTLARPSDEMLVLVTYSRELNLVIPNWVDSYGALDNSRRIHLCTPNTPNGVFLFAPRRCVRAGPSPS